MTSRNAVAACLLLVLSPAHVRLTRDQNAVIAAAFERRFPDHSKPLLVSRIMVDSHSMPRAARNSGWPYLLDSVALGRPVTLVQGTADAVILTPPEIVGDEAMFDYIFEGTAYDVLLSRENGKWIVMKQNRVPPPLPPPAVQSTRPIDPDAPLRVGGDVKAPVIVKRVEPVSTRMAKRAHISGIVILEIIVDKEGHLTNMHILKPLPMGLDGAAEQAVRQWEFRPGTLNGKPVATIVNVTVTFHNE